VKVELVGEHFSLPCLLALLTAATMTAKRAHIIDFLDMKRH